ncbi:MAG: DNA recombination protein RmuC [Acidimicrobiales bacterium]
MDIALLITALLLAAGLIWMISQARAALAESARQSAEAARLHAEREARLREQLARTEASAATDDQLRDSFSAIAQEALAAQSAQLVQLAEAKYGALQQNTDTVLAGHSKAVGEGLQTLAERLAALERERSDATSSLRAVVGELTVANRATQAEAAKLAAAMRDNRVRGAWGEVQLRRVLEIAGLDRHAHFVEQRSTDQRGADGDASRGRPDVVIPLANGRCVVVDAKVPLDRYLEAANAGDPDVERRLQVEHAKAVAHHVNALAHRDYVAKVDGSVDMVLLFLPGEPFLAAALDADPALFESAAAKGVHLVTPSSLVPVLRGIALGWREHQAEQAAAEIQQLGIELYERIALFADHFANVGKQLDRTVSAFNKSVGSLDTRVMSTARKLSEHGAGSTRTLPEVVEVPTATRPIRMLELVRPVELREVMPAGPQRASGE